MTKGINSYLNPKLDAAEVPGKGRCGVLAFQSVQAGELLAVWGGRIVDYTTFSLLSEVEKMHSVQVEDNLYQIPVGPIEAADCINHSCDPNAGFRGQISLVALRDIRAGEEICIDYAMCDSTPYDEFECECGASDCRGFITGDDWKSTALWQKYDGHFSSYLQTHIDSLRRSN